MHGPGLSSRLRSSLRGFTLGASALLIVILLLSSTFSTREGSTPRVTTTPTTTALIGTTVPSRLRPSVTKAMLAHRCSIQPIPTTSQAWSALVIIKGSVRQVSFDRGWAIYTGTKRGRFIALCRDPVEPGR